MNANKIFSLLALVTLGLVIAACASAPAVQIEPTAVTASSTPALTEIGPTTGTAPATKPPAPTRAPTVTPKPTATVMPADDDEMACRSACHVPDPNELMAANAKPQPSDHKGRTACLSCHATLAKPALPATHLGRQDAACSGCHKAK